MPGRHPVHPRRRADPEGAALPVRLHHHRLRRDQRLPRARLERDDAEDGRPRARLPADRLRRDAHGGARRHHRAHRGLRACRPRTTSRSTPTRRSPIVAAARDARRRARAVRGRSRARRAPSSPPTTARSSASREGDAGVARSRRRRSPPRRCSRSRTARSPRSATTSIPAAPRATTLDDADFARLGLHVKELPALSRDRGRGGRGADGGRRVARRRDGARLLRAPRHEDAPRVLVPLRDHVRGALHPDDDRHRDAHRALPDAGARGARARPSSASRRAWSGALLATALIVAGWTCFILTGDDLDHLADVRDRQPAPRLHGALRRDDDPAPRGAEANLRAGDARAARSSWGRRRSPPASRASRRSTCR